MLKYLYSSYIMSVTNKYEHSKLVCKCLGNRTMVTFATCIQANLPVCLAPSWTADWLLVAVLTGESHSHGTYLTLSKQQPLSAQLLIPYVPFTSGAYISTRFSKHTIFFLSIPEHWTFEYNMMRCKYTGHILYEPSKFSQSSDRKLISIFSIETIPS